MVFFYNVFILLLHQILKVGAIFNPKARLWIDGRKDIFNQIEEKIKALSPLYTQKIWIHVASLGEFEQGRPIIEGLKAQNPHIAIILTFFSPSGYEIRKNYPLADAIFYLPLDTRTNAQQFLDIIQPDIAIFVKYEFWYHYLHNLKQRNIPTILVSGIFRENQFQSWSPYSYFFKRMLACFTHFFVQNTPSVLLLKKQGFENITLAGDTRIDRVAKIPEEGRTFPLIEQFLGNAPTLVCGSTWQADEEIIIPLLKDKNYQNWAFIFAPHDISASNIERLMTSLPQNAVKYSNLQGEIPPQYSPKILVIDNVGILSALYRYGRVAYIGGGFGKGIHNILEPITFSLPVFFGKNYHKFEEANRLIEIGGAFSIQNYNDFQEKMRLLNNDNFYKKTSEAAYKYIKDNQGATDLILVYLNIYTSK